MTEENDKQQSPNQGMSETPAEAGASPAGESTNPDPKPPATPGPPKKAAGDAGIAGDDAAGNAGTPGQDKPAVPKPPAKPAPPKKPKGPTKEPYTGPLVDALNEKFPGQFREAYTFLKLRHLVIGKERLTEVMAFLRYNDVEPFDFLSDETATHWPGDEEFELVYVLFSFVTNARIVVKVRTKEWETVESLVGVWPGADWLEREIYDMFGVRFVNHPNLKRILLPEDWNGFPLRKDYDIRLQDVEWVRKHLGIESGQRFYVGEARHDDA